MSRLDNYLIEKISKIEYNDILNDKSVVIGAEFEFYQTSHKDMIGSGNNDEDWADFYYFTEQMTKYEADMEDYEEDEIAYGNYQSEYDDWVEAGKTYEEPEEPDAPNKPEPPEIPEYVLNVENTREINNMIARGYIPDPTYYTNMENDNQEVINRIESEVGDLISDTDNWEFKGDSSLDTQGISSLGIEIATSPMTLAEFLDVVPKVFDYIDYTDDTCGFHVSISFEGMNLKDDFDSFKIALFMEEEYVYKYFKSRKGNQYAKSAFSDVIKKGNFKPDILKNLIDKKKANRSITSSHYMGINIENISEYDTDSRVEFRYLGNKDYHKKWPEIKNIIVRYVYFMKLACDPNYKKKEYLTKIQRMINKIEFVRLGSFMDGIKSIIDGGKFIDWKIDQINSMLEGEGVAKDLAEKYFSDFEYDTLQDYNSEMLNAYLTKAYRKMQQDYKMIGSSIKLTSREKTLIDAYVLGV